MLHTTLAGKLALARETEEETGLFEAIAEAERGETISSEELFIRLDRLP
jgi:hypothetical protein